MFHRCSFISLTLALVAVASLPVSTNAQEAQSTSQPVSADGSEQWPAAVRNFWAERAAQTRLIHGEYWSVKVQLEGEQLAAGKSPALQDKALAYQQPGAPNYIRLHDGKKAMCLGDIASEVEGLTIFQGRVTAVKGDVMTLMYYERPSRYKEIIGLSPQQQAEYAAMIKPLKEPQQPAKIITKVTTDSSLREVITIVSLPLAPVTAEELRQACREMELTAFDDYRPVKTVQKPDFQGETRTVAIERMRYLNSTYTRQDFTWYKHAIIIPALMR